MTGSNWATQPDGHILRYGELGLGAAVWLHNQNNNGVDCRRVSSIDWVPALVAAADATSQRDLRTDVLGAKAVRDKIHQDQVGARAAIDWRAFDYRAAFVRAIEAMRILFALSAATVPDNTDLN